MALDELTLEDLEALHGEVTAEINRRRYEGTRSKAEKRNELHDDPKFHSLQGELQRFYEGRDVEIPLNAGVTVALYAFPSGVLGEPFEMEADDVQIDVIHASGEVLDSFEINAGTSYLDLPEVKAALAKLKEEVEQEMENKDIRGRVALLAETHELPEDEIWSELE